MYINCLLSFLPSSVYTKNFLKDADQIQKTYLTLLSNQSAAAAWMSRVLDSVVMVISEVITHQRHEDNACTCVRYVRISAQDHFISFCV